MIGLSTKNSSRSVANSRGRLTYFFTQFVEAGEDASDFFHFGSIFWSWEEVFEHSLLSQPLLDFLGSCQVVMDGRALDGKRSFKHQTGRPFNFTRILVRGVPETIEKSNQLLPFLSYILTN